MNLKSLFTTKNNKIESVNETDLPMYLFDFKDYGKKQAQDLGGHPEVIHPALHATYLRVKQIIINDKNKQQENQNKIQGEIDKLKSKYNELVNKKETKHKDLLFDVSQIEDAKSEISAINKDPSRILNEKGSPIASFIIGLIIILFLTIYLFVFYSSAAYSAFFKEFSPNALGIATAIFDPQALGKAYQDGVTEAILILTIPAVFLGLGYLIHRIQNDTNTKPIFNYLKMCALIVVTFAFDSILAYKITEEIYEIRRAGSFDPLPEFNVSLALYDIKFWTIIFSGFVVYLIWGLVFNFVMQEYYKLDRVKVAKDDLERKIKDYKTTCKSLKSDIEIIDGEISQNDGEIKRLESLKANGIISKADVQLEVNNFVTGWLSYMEYKNFPDYEKQQVIKIKDAFLAGISNQFVTI